MNRKQIGILAVLLLFLTLRFIVTPLLDRQQPLKIVQHILKIWESTDVSSAYEYWKDINTVPPIDNLKRFHILSNKYYKEKGIKKAEITVSLEFDKHPVMPPKSTWTFEMEKTFDGWQVIRFKQDIP